MNPPATAESIENPATTETIKTFSCHDGNHKQNKAETMKNRFLRRRKPQTKTTTDTIKKRWMMSTTETIKRPDGFRDELSIYKYISIYVYKYILI